MTINDSGLELRHLELVAELASRVSRLSAVATQDWCARAADLIRGIRPTALVSVTIAGVRDHGELSFVEATGAAGLDPQGRSADVQPIHPDHASSLGWWIPGSEEIRVGLLHGLPGASEWASSPAGRRWSRYGATDLVVGVAPMPGHVVGRSLVVEFGLGPNDRPFDRAELNMLRAVLPLLARRAGLAFGPEVSSPLTRLTSREQEVLEHLALGKSVKEIAEDLARSPHTVHDHVKSLHRKLNASSRGELIARSLGHLEDASGSSNGSKRLAPADKLQFGGSRSARMTA